MTNQMKEEMYNLLQNYINELTMAIERSKGVLTDLSFIVIIDSLPINFDFDGRNKLSNPRVGKPHLVRRFNKENARILAKQVKNGRGHSGSVILWHEAAYNRIAIYQDLLARIYCKKELPIEVVR